MKLIVDELVTYLEQKITTSGSPTQLGAIRPHLYKHNNPAGTLKIQLRDSSNVLLKESDAVTIQEITDVTNAFTHGYIRFLLKCGLLPNTDYYIRLVASGYSFSESAYIGWCKDFDLRKYEASYSPSVGIRSAFDYEAWGYQDVRKGEL